MIRWKYLLPRLGFLVFAILLVNVLSEPLTRQVLVHSAQSMTGARVNIGNVRASLWNGRIELKNLQVADPGNPMKNLVQADQAELDLSAAKLLHKQWIVENATLKRLQFGTPRTESGALPGAKPRPPEEESVLVQIVRDQVSAAGRQWLQQIESRIPLLIEENLETVQLARELRQRWPEEFDRQRQRALDLREQARQIRSLLTQRSDNPLRDLEQFKNALLGAQQVMNEISAAQQALHQLNRQFKHDKSALVAAQERDRQKIVSMASDLSLDGTTLSGLLLGESQSRQVEEVVNWIKWFRSAIPDPDTDFQPVRARGYDVQFRRRPGFVMQNVQLSGEGMLGGQNYHFAGTAKNLSTTPQLLDEPATLQLRGQGRSHIHISAVVDRRKARKIDRINIRCPSLPRPGQVIGSPDSLRLTVSPGTMSLEIDAEIIDDQISGKILVQQSGVAIDVQKIANIAGGPSLVSSLRQELPSLESFEIEVELNGSINQPKMELHSDLGPRIAEMLGRACESSVAEAAATKSVELRKILDQHLASLDQIYAVNTNDILRLLSSEVTEIADLQKYLDSPGSALPTFR